MCSIPSFEMYSLLRVIGDTPLPLFGCLPPILLHTLSSRRLNPRPHRLPRFHWRSMRLGPTSKTVDPTSLQPPLQPIQGPILMYKVLLGRIVGEYILSPLTQLPRQQQVITSRQRIMLVILDILQQPGNVHPQLLQLVNDEVLDGDARHAEDYAVDDGGF
jgi:hypothetical protein